MTANKPMSKEEVIRQALEDSIKEMRLWLSLESCDCPPEGHICGRPRLLRSIEQAEEALVIIPQSQPMSEDTAKKILKSISAYWKISTQDLGRELCVIPADEKQVIQAIIHIANEDLPSRLATGIKQESTKEVSEAKTWDREGLKEIIKHWLGVEDTPKIRDKFFIFERYRNTTELADAIIAFQEKANNRSGKEKEGEE